MLVVNSSSMARSPKYPGLMRKHHCEMSVDFLALRDHSSPGSTWLDHYLVPCPGEKASSTLPLKSVSLDICIDPDELEIILATSCIIMLPMHTYGICVEQHDFALFFVLRYLRCCSTLRWHQDNQRRRTVPSSVWTWFMRCKRPA